MQQASGYIVAGSEQLHYLRVGNGKHLLLGFPGYGHNGDSLLPLAAYLQEKYTCILIDHPHHGLSKWQPKSVFTRPMLKEMCMGLMKEYGVEKMSLLGYSMGGRVCLTIIEDMGEHIDAATLIASDGLARNKYYFFFTRTALGRKLFSSMLQKPEPYIGVINWLKNHKWISEWQHKFVSYYVGDTAIRTKLSLVWPAMSQLMPNKGRVLAALLRNNIHVHLLMGKYDKVIPAVLGQRFAAGNPNIQLQILDKGHHIIGADTARQIAQTLL